MRPLVLLLAAAAIVAGPGAASADDGQDGLLYGPRVITIPTAWIQPELTAHLSGDADFHLDSGARFAVRMGRLVEIDLAADDLLQSCDPCSGLDRATEGVQLGSVGWKLGVWQDAWFRHQPALALGVRVPIAAATPAWSDAPPRAAEAFVVASRVIGPLRLHAGLSAWQTEHVGRDGAVIAQGDLLAVRPIAGFEWTPKIYPKTSLAADVQWTPELGPTAGETGRRWLFAWGVRYRAFPWSAIELAVKHRQGDDLSDAAIMVRLMTVLSKKTDF